MKKFNIFLLVLISTCILSVFFAFYPFGHSQKNDIVNINNCEMTSTNSGNFQGTLNAIITQNKVKCFAIDTEENFLDQIQTKADKKVITIRIEKALADDEKLMVHLCIKNLKEKKCIDKNNIESNDPYKLDVLNITAA
jgi:hypothetical protein